MGVHGGLGWSSSPWLARCPRALAITLWAHLLPKSVFEAGKEEMWDAQGRDQRPELLVPPLTALPRIPGKMMMEVAKTERKMETMTAQAVSTGKQALAPG